MPIHIINKYKLKKYMSNIYTLLFNCENSGSTKFALHNKFLLEIALVLWRKETVIVLKTNIAYKRLEN